MEFRTKPMFREHVRGGGKVDQTNSSNWHLEIPAGSSGSYRLAQLDDYAGLSRRSFLWNPPINLRLRARASARNIPGTWGFGFWNDPFGTALIAGSEMRLPTLPNAAWFFFASPPNYLSFRDDLPGRGQIAATFRSPTKLPPRLIVSFPLLPLVVLPPIARKMRCLLRRFVHQDTVEFDLDPTEWQVYEIDWRAEEVVFLLDGQVLRKMSTHPRSPLGLVMWIDNQYASWLPTGQLGYGTLTNPEAAWVELEGLKLTLA